MNDYALGQLINQVFVPYALNIGAMVVAALVLLLLYVTYRDEILNFEGKE